MGKIHESIEWHGRMRMHLPVLHVSNMDWYHPTPISTAMSLYKHVQYIFIYFVFCEHNLCKSKTKDFANEKWNENSNYWQMFSVLYDNANTKEKRTGSVWKKNQRRRRWNNIKRNGHVLFTLLSIFHWLFVKRSAFKFKNVRVRFSLFWWFSCCCFLFCSLLCQFSSPFSPLHHHIALPL